MFLPILLFALEIAKEARRADPTSTTSQPYQCARAPYRRVSGCGRLRRLANRAEQLRRRFFGRGDERWRNDGKLSNRGNLHALRSNLRHGRSGHHRFIVHLQRRHHEVGCQLTFVDSAGGPGTGTQTTRFASRSDLVDEVAVVPPVSRALGTTTVTSAAGGSLTTTATHTYDGQRRLMSTQVVTAPIPVIGSLTTITTYSSWDASGRPTAGTATGPGGSTVTISYDNTNRTVTQNTGPNTCTQTYDQNGIIIREGCTGTTASTTVVTVNSTQQVCK